MSFYGIVFRLTGWLVGLLLITGEVTYYSDGHTDGSQVAVGVVILVLWCSTTIWPFVRRVQHERAVVQHQQLAVAAHLEALLGHSIAEAEVVRREADPPVRADLPTGDKETSGVGKNLAMAVKAEFRGIQSALASIAVAYYEETQRDPNNEKLKLHNYGVAQAYDSVASDFGALVADVDDRFGLASKLREVGQVAGEDARQTTDWVRKTQGFGMSSGYSAIAKALEAEDAVWALLEIQTLVTAATVGQPGVKKR